MKITEILKSAAAVASSITIIAALLTAIIKPFQRRFAKWIIKVSGIITCDDKIDNLSEKISDLTVSVKVLDNALEAHIRQGSDERALINSSLNDANNKLDASVESQRNMCRNIITELYYEFIKSGCMPRYKHELLIKTYMNYKSLNGNSYIDEIYSELKDIKITDK